MCSLRSELPSNCERRTRWLKQPNPTVQPQSTEDNDSQIQKISQLFAAGTKSLIWIDATDVNSVRAAVELTRAACATIHIGSSTSAQNFHRILTSEGWIGTSLAEVATQADLIVTLGNGILTEAPLLRERFIAPAVEGRQATWCHISDSELPIAGTNWQEHWPRSQWYAKLTQLLLAIQEPQKLGENSTQVNQLAQQLLDSRYAVWLWDADEFCNTVDELCIRRLLGLARALSAHSRCSLLRLESDVGRATAEETLLWLTGFSPTASYDGQRWHSRLHTENYTLEGWQQEFDSILFLRTVPTVRPMPGLAASHYILPSTANVSHLEQQSTTGVATCGVDYAGHLWRGDRAMALFCPPVKVPDASTPQRTAEDVLERVRREVEQRRLAHVN